MTPIFLNPTHTNSSSSSFPFMELQEDQCDHHSSLQLFLAPQHNNQSSSSSLCSTKTPPDDQFARRNPSSDDPSNHNDYIKVYDEYTTHGRESSDHNSHHQVDSDHQYYNKVSSAKQVDEVGENVRDGNGSSMKWMSSKVRLMRKMIHSDHKAPSWRIELKTTQRDHYQQPESSEMGVVENNNGGDIIRVCSNCNTTKTPLWRSGPQGPKSLCNACGIRQRKARREMEAAAAAGSATVETGGGEGSSSSTSVKSTLKLVTKKKKARSSHYNLAEHNRKSSAHHHKQQFDQVKESFVEENNEKNLWFEEFAKNLLMKNSSFQRMFTQDEEEGAVLLMALAYGHGLVQS